MQQTNNLNEENRNVLIALELYRLQSLRNMLLVILLIQLMLVGIGLRVILQGNRLAPSPKRLGSDNSTNNSGHDGFGFHPDELHSGPEKRVAVTMPGHFDVWPYGAEVRALQTVRLAA